MHRKKKLAAKNASAQDSPAADFDCIITNPTTIESVIHRAFFESKPSKSKPAKSKHLKKEIVYLFLIFP